MSVLEAITYVPCVNIRYIPTLYVYIYFQMYVALRVGALIYSRRYTRIYTRYGEWFYGNGHLTAALSISI